jgi:hypothetical protein
MGVTHHFLLPRKKSQKSFKKPDCFCEAWRARATEDFEWHGADLSHGHAPRERSAYGRHPREHERRQLLGAAFARLAWQIGSLAASLRE